MNECRKLLAVFDTGRKFSKQAGAFFFFSCLELGMKSILGFGATLHVVQHLLPASMTVDLEGWA